MNPTQHQHIATRFEAAGCSIGRLAAHLATVRIRRGQ
jgi:hypothetical protein